MTPQHLNVEIACTAYVQGDTPSLPSADTLIGSFHRLLPAATTIRETAVPKLQGMQDNTFVILGVTCRLPLQTPAPVSTYLDNMARGWARRVLKGLNLRDGMLSYRITIRNAGVVVGGKGQSLSLLKAH